MATRTALVATAVLTELRTGETVHGAELARRTGFTQPPVWRALKTLESAGKVRSQKIGTVRFYEMAADPTPDPTLVARRKVQAIALRRGSRGSGSDLRLMKARRRLMDWWGEAERALAEVPHAVVGGVAAAAYMPGRSTDDIDIAVAGADVNAAEAAIRKAGWTKTGNLDLVEGTIWEAPAGHELDLITMRQPWAVDAILSAQRNNIAGLPTMPLPYLALMKLIAGRLTDMGDLARMLGLADESDRQAARSMVERFGTPEDSEDLAQVIALGVLEAGEFRAGQGPGIGI